DSIRALHHVKIRDDMARAIPQKSGAGPERNFRKVPSAKIELILYVVNKYDRRRSRLKHLDRVALFGQQPRWHIRAGIDRELDARGLEQSVHYEGNRE